MEYIIKLQSRDKFLDDQGEKIQVVGIEVGAIDVYADGCDSCEGTGLIDEDECWDCEGKSEDGDEYLYEDNYTPDFTIKDIDGNYYIVTDIPFDWDFASDEWLNWSVVEVFDDYEKVSNWIKNIPEITYSKAVENGWIVSQD